MRKDGPLAVDVPAPDRDNPGWIKVGVIAAIGFVIGVAWPRLMGVKLGPSAPGEASASASASASAASSVAQAPQADAPPASVAKAATPAVASVGATAVAAGGPPQVGVTRGGVLSCKTTDGEIKKGTKECGRIPDLDNVVAPHLRKLATCSAAEGESGKLSFLATADFPSGRLGWEIGRSSTLANTDGIRNCLKTHFSGVTATGIAHEHARYTVVYHATFSAPTAPSPAKDSVKNASKEKDEAEKAEAATEDTGAKEEKIEKVAAGEASVGWEVALVRDAAKTGAIVARLPRGTKVKVGAMKDGWYAIKFGDGFSGDGYVYRGAIGR